MRVAQLWGRLRPQSYSNPPGTLAGLGFPLRPPFDLVGRNHGLVPSGSSKELPQKILPVFQSTQHSYKKGQNMLEILQDCFEDQSKASFLDDFTESLTSSTQKKKANYSQSSSKKCPESHSKPVPVSSRTGEASLQASAEPSEAAGGSVQANEVHHGASDELDLCVGSPVVLLDANVNTLQKAASPAGQKRVASVSRSPVDRQASNKNISFKTRKRLNFEDKVTLSTAETENSVLQVEDNLSKGQEGTSSEITQKRDDLSSDVQSRSGLRLHC